MITYAKGPNHATLAPAKYTNIDASTMGNLAPLLTILFCIKSHFYHPKQTKPDSCPKAMSNLDRSVLLLSASSP